VEDDADRAAGVRDARSLLVVDVAPVRRHARDPGVGDDEGSDASCAPRRRRSRVDRRCARSTKMRRASSRSTSSIPRIVSPRPMTSWRAGDAERGAREVTSVTWTTTSPQSSTRPRRDRARSRPGFRRTPRASPRSSLRGTPSRSARARRHQARARRSRVGGEVVCERPCTPRLGAKGVRRDRQIAPVTRASRSRARRCASRSARRTRRAHGVARGRIREACPDDASMCRSTTSLAR